MVARRTEPRGPDQVKVTIVKSRCRLWRWGGARITSFLLSSNCKRKTRKRRNNKARRASNRDRAEQDQIGNYQSSLPCLAANLRGNQVANSKEDQFRSTPAPRRRVNDNGNLLGRVTGGEGAILHGFKVEPGLSPWAQLQLVYKRLPAQLAVSRVSRPIAGIFGNDLADSHLDAARTTQVISKPPRLSQGPRERRKHQAHQDGNDCHHAKQFNQAESSSPVW